MTPSQMEFTIRQCRIDIKNLENEVERLRRLAEPIKIEIVEADTGVDPRDTGEYRALGL